MNYDIEKAKSTKLADDIEEQRKTTSEINKKLTQTKEEFEIKYVNFIRKYNKVWQY